MKNSTKFFSINWIFKLTIFLFFISTFNSAFAQKTEVAFDLRYPSGNTLYDEIIFGEAKAVLHEDLNFPFKFYELEKKDWVLGSLFQLVINANEKNQGHFYVFGQDAEKNINIFYPNNNENSIAHCSELTVAPSYRSAINLNNYGEHKLVILYAPTVIKDWSTIQTQLQESRENDLQQLVANLLGNQLENATNYVYAPEKIGFRFKKAKGIIPLFINIKCPPAPEKPEKVNLHVLSIGPSFIDLKYTKKDAQDMIELIKKKGYKRYNSISFTSLLGADATVKNMERAISELKLKSEQGAIQKEDKILIYISSHGFLHNDELSIASVEHDILNPKQTSLQYSTIYNKLKNVASQKIILLDVSASNGIMPDETIVYTPESPIKPLKEENFYTILSNCQNEVSYEDDVWENGAFTEAIIEAINGKADTEKDGWIKFSELFNYVTKRTKEISKNVKNKSQTPVLPRPEYVDFELF